MFFDDWAGMYGTPSIYTTRLRFLLKCLGLWAESFKDFLEADGLRFLGYYGVIRKIVWFWGFTGLSVLFDVDFLFRESLLGTIGGVKVYTLSLKFFLFCDILIEFDAEFAGLEFPPNEKF